MGAAIALCLTCSIILNPFGLTASASRSSMTGDYVKDTVLVAQSLQETIALPKDDASRTDSEESAVKLITDYISRYRNRPQVNETVSFTTMQTALNAMAGHYKTFANRPLPDDLKERLNKELSQAEKMVTRET